MSIIEKLNKPYPQILVLSRWKASFIIGLFVGLFIVIFQPFGLQHIETSYKEIKLLGYGLVTLIFLLFNLVLLPVFLPKIFNEDNWTVKKQILFQSWIVLSISIGNYLYSAAILISPWVGFNGFFVFATFTLLIGIFPIVAITYITQLIYLQKNVKDSSLINTQISEIKKEKQISTDEISFTNGKQDLKFKIEDLLYIESEGNYVNIYHNENSNIKNALIRNTLKNIESEIESNLLFKCHRAFIVNLSIIEEVKGNSQGYKLVLKNIDKEIPVARSYTKDFKERMQFIKNT